MLSQWNCFLGSSAWGSNLPSSHGRSWLTVCGLSPYLRDPAVPWRLKTYSSENNWPFTKSAKSNHDASTTSRGLCWCCSLTVSHGQDALANVTPKTFIGWHRAGFRLFWRWKSRPGRPPIPIELRRLIREMALSNLSWGEERIANELLLKLGICVSPRTVRKLWFPKTHITHYHAANLS